MLLMLKANQAVRNTMAAERILLAAKDCVRKDKRMLDYHRAAGFMKLEMAIVHLYSQLPTLPEAWWCSDCELIGCEHAVEHARLWTKPSAAKASAAC
jgi:hypothetical protein